MEANLVVCRTSEHQQGPSEKSGLLHEQGVLNRELPEIKDVGLLSFTYCMQFCALLPAKLILHRPYKMRGKVPAKASLKIS